LAVIAYAEAKAARLGNEFRMQSDIESDRLRKARRFINLPDCVQLLLSCTR
jgi:hypothetical protein